MINHLAWAFFQIWLFGPLLWNCNIQQLLFKNIKKYIFKFKNINWTPLLDFIVFCSKIGHFEIMHKISRYFLGSFEKIGQIYTKNLVTLQITVPTWHLGSMKANGREPKSCLGRVFNFKLGCFVKCTTAWPEQARPSLKLKTWPRFHPHSSSLSMMHPRKDFPCYFCLSNCDIYLFTFHFCLSNWFCSETSFIYWTKFASVTETEIIYV